MPKKILQIIQSAYRATIEEQDDTIVWLAHMIKDNGGTTDVLLRGNAVNYAVQGQDCSGLQFGNRKQTQPPKLDDDLAKLIPKGVAVYVVEEDLARRGLEGASLIPGLQRVSIGGLPKLFGNYDQVWQW